MERFAAVMAGVGRAATGSVLTIDYVPGAGTQPAIDGKLQGYSFSKMGARYPSAGGFLEYVVRGWGDGHFTGVIAWMLLAVNAIITASYYGVYSNGTTSLGNDTLSANRYGVIENSTDYDIRGLLTLREHLFGGTEARIAQAEARARSADAHADRIRDEAARDASIAWSDVQALNEQFQATQESYIAARRSRDVLVERFVYERGNLFDVVASEDSYFETATAYIRALSELDAARYVLLARTGGLLPALGIDPVSIGGRRD